MTSGLRKPAAPVIFAATALFGTLLASLFATPAQAQYTDGVVKIGILSDMSSLYSDIGGPGSVVAAKLAVEDFNPAAHA